ncbi:hypothetical protein ACRJ4B_09945 [Streptomyces sp. GTA36]
MGAAVAQAMADEGAKVVMGDALDEEGRCWRRRSGRP